MTRRRAEPHRLLALALAASALAAHAQEAARPGGGLTVQPRVGLSQAWTDNLRLDNQNKDAALITTVSPGVSIVSNSGFLRGSLDYSLNGIAYLKSAQASQVQNALSAIGQAELVSRTLFVDVRASIGQQNASAFGVQSAPTLGSQSSTSPLASANQREVGSLVVAPSLRGLLAGLASYEARGEYSITEARGTSFGDSRGSGFTLRLNQWQAGIAAWWLQADTHRVKAVDTASNASSTLRGGLNYRPDVDWLLTFGGGYERNDYRGAGTQSGSTASVSAEWTPSPRTHVNADWQRHGYGDSHSLNFEHRMSRSVWRLADTSTVSLGNIGASGGARSYYDQFFLLFASVEPDPVKRDELVRAYLQAQGLPADGVAAGGFLSTGPSRLRNQLVSVTLQGVRSSLTAQAGRTLTTRLADHLNQGDLATTSQVEQRSYSLTLSHQLTPLSGMSLIASRQQTRGDIATQSARLTSLVANWNARLGPRLGLQLGGRHSRFEGVTPYTENTVYANLTQQL